MCTPSASRLVQYMSGSGSPWCQIHDRSWLSTNGPERGHCWPTLSRWTEFICSTHCIASRLAEMVKLWQQCHFYDPYSRIRGWCNQANCGISVMVAAVSIIKESLSGAFTDTHAPTGTHTHIQPHRYSLTSAHSNRLWTVNLWCVNQIQFFYEEA